MEQKGICREVGESNKVIFRNKRSVEGGRVSYGKCCGILLMVRSDTEAIPKVYKGIVRIEGYKGKGRYEGV